MKDLRNEILSLIPEEKKGALVGDELFFECPNPNHEDENYTNCSINLKTGVYYCFACGEKGNLKKLKRIYKGGTNHEVFDPFNPKSRGKPNKKFVW